MGFVPSISIAFLMLFVCMIAWGSWTNTLKKCGNWRFEAYYWDYAWSIVASTFLLGIVLGGFTSTGWSAVVFFNKLANVSVEGALWATFAGFVWGVGNLLLVIAIELAGIAIAFPLGIGLSLVIGTFLAYFTHPAATKNPEFLFMGLLIVTLAIIANGLAYRVKESANKKNKSLTRGLVISVLCGLFISLFPFPFNYAFKLGLTGYEGALFMTIGGFLATVIVLPIIMKKPLVPNAKPVGLEEYKRAKPSWHVWGIFAGFIWSVGTVFNLVVASTPNFSVAIAYTLGACAPMVAALWGIFVWKEFKGAPRVAYLYLGIMFVLFIGGIISLANATG